MKISYIVLCIVISFVNMFSTTVSAKGFFEFQWPGKDCWEVRKGQKKVSKKCSTSSVELEPGRYEISPDYYRDKVFKPFSIVINENKNTVVKPRVGMFEFLWLGEDCWEIYRAEKVVAKKCGSNSIFLEEGTYKVVPGRYNDKRIFKPFDIKIEDKKKLKVDLKRPFIIKLNHNYSPALFFIDRQEDKVVAIYGKNGNINDIDNITVASLKEKNTWVSFELDSNNSPKKIETPNETLIVNSYIGDNKVKIEDEKSGRSYVQKIDIEKLNESINLIDKYEKSSLSFEENCKSDLIQIIPAIPQEIDDLIQGALLTWSVYGCVTGLVGVASGIGAMPGAALAGWSCGSALMGVVEKVNNDFLNSPLKPIYFEFSKPDSLASTAVACAGKDTKGCTIGILSFLYDQVKDGKQKKVTSCHIDKSQCCYGFDEFCKNAGGVPGIWKDSCSCNISDIGHPALCEPGENPCGDKYAHDSCMAGGHMCIAKGKKWPRECDK